MRRFLVILIVITIVMNFGPMGFSEEIQRPNTVEQSLKLANDELREFAGIRYEYFTFTNANDYSLNKELAVGNWIGMAGLKSLGTDCMFVYGYPSELNSRVGRHRYLGETIDGDKFTNMFFPHDSWAGGTLEQRRWIEEPWNDTRLKNSVSTVGKFDAPKINDKYLPNIIAGLEAYYSDVLDGSYKTKDWQNYIHVLQPPTKFAWGMGRMWHQTADGRIWYITIPLTPHKMDGVDIATKIVDTGVLEGQKAEPGQKYTATIEYSIKGTERTPECFFKEASNYLLYGGVTLNKAYAEDAGDGVLKRTFTKEWICPKKAQVTLESFVYPDAVEKDITNNKDTAVVETTYIPINLKVRIMDYTRSQYPGALAGIKAIVTSDMAEPVKTTAVWRVNGGEIARNDNFIIKGSRESNINIPMPEDSDACVELVINPDKNAPEDEDNWEDNKASCVVDFLIPESKISVPNYSVSITAPGQLQYNPQWKLQKLIDNYPEVIGYYNNAKAQYKASVKVNQTWKQTYHYVKTSDSYTDENGIYHPARYKRVADPPPTYTINLNVTMTGNMAKSLDYSSAYEAEGVPEKRTTNISKTFTLTGNDSEVVNVDIPLYHSFNFNDTCRINASIGQGASDSKTISIKGVKPYPLDILQSR